MGRKTKADQYIKNGAVKNVLVIGTEKITSLLDWKDRNTCVLFGDGAGTVVLSASDQAGILSNTIGSNGSYKDLLTVNTIHYPESNPSDNLSYQDQNPSSNYHQYN